MRRTTCWPKRSPCAARGATTATLARLLLELGRMQLAAGRLADAERSLREVHDAGTVVDASTARAAAERLAELYVRQGKPERARELRAGADGGR